MPPWPFKKLKLETNATDKLETNATDKLEKALQELEILEKSYTEKASQQVEKAKEFTRAKNKPAATQSMKRKRQYEEQIEQLQNSKLRIHEQMIMVEGAKATTETVDALRTGAAEMKAMLKGKNIDDMNNIMDEIQEGCEDMKQMQEAVAGPSGAAADFDVDELEAELEELEGAESEEQLLPATTASATPEHVIGGPLPAPPPPQGSD